ncbi:MAG TPA: helix-turn-helix domain-containing protein [Stellaceae bacterium]
MIPEKLLSKGAVAEILGLHPTSVMRLCREGRFPAPLRTGDLGSAVRFRSTDVSEWINRRAGALNASGNVAGGVSR